MRQTLLFFSFCLIFGCQEPLAPISKKKMSEVLTDLHLAEALGQVSPIDSGGYMIKNRDSIFVYYQDIFDNHQVNPQEFNAGLDWYGEHPEDFDKIYDLVLSNLSTIKESKIENIEDDSNKVSVKKKGQLASKQMIG